MEWIKNLKFIFKPRYWLMNNPYNPYVDHMVSRLLDKYEFTDLQPHSASLGGVRIWTSNRPYACMTIHETGLSKYRPSRLTIERGIKKIEEAERKQLNDRIEKQLQRIEEKIK